MEKYLAQESVLVVGSALTATRVLKLTLQAADVRVTIRHLADISDRME
jgi:hypothetical protein